MKLEMKHLVYLGWLSFALSLFMPVYSFMDARFAGWETFLISFAAMGEFYKRWDAAFLSLAGLINMLYILSPLLYWQNERGRWQWSWKAMAFSSLVSVSYFKAYDLKTGYFFWAASSIFLTIGLYYSSRSARRA